MDDCRPVGFLIGLPFAFVALLLSLVGPASWLIGTLASFVCPSCICCAGMANLAISLVKVPLKVLQWFVGLIPC